MGIGVRHESKFAYTNASAFSIFGELLGSTYLHFDDIGKTNYDDYFTEAKKKILDECRTQGKENMDKDCSAFVENGHATFCKYTSGFAFCNNAVKLVMPPPTTTTTTTTTTAATTAKNDSFPIGTFIGGFMAGAFLGFVFMLIILFLCRKKKKPSGVGEFTVQGKDNTATGTGGETTTNTSTTKKQKKKKEKKAKKAKKQKKGKKNTTKTTGTTQTTSTNV